jgi:hypothetical protein
VTLRSDARQWHMDMYSGTEAAAFAGALYLEGESVVALGYRGASALDEAVLRVAEGRARAQVSTTWLPCVFMILIFWPWRTRVAAPRRAGTVWVEGMVG